MHNKRREMLDLVEQRQAHLTAAEKALTAGDQETYNREMAEAISFNGRIQAISDLLAEQDRFEVGSAVGVAADTAQIEDMVQRMREGHGRMTMTVDEVRGMMNSTLISTDTLATPRRVGTNIRDNHDVVSAVLDRVNVEDLQGCSQMDEPYVKTMQTADAATPQPT